MGLDRITDLFLLAENRLLREALVRLLAKEKDIRVVGANSYSPGVQEEIIAVRPSIILFDSNSLMFSEASLVPALQTSIPDVKMIMVDVESDESKFLKAVRDGVVGYLSKNASVAEVAATIRAVAFGEAVYPSALSMGFVPGGISTGDRLGSRTRSQPKDEMGRRGAA
jgi:DNA-binding NarL/FixJ family response regulator